LTELQERIIGVCLYVMRDMNQIARVCNDYQLQSVRNSVYDLCLMGYLSKRKKGNRSFFFATEKARNYREGKIEINPLIEERSCNDPGQIMLTKFMEK